MNIRRATKQDNQTILTFIKELAQWDCCEMRQI